MVFELSAIARNNHEKCISILYTNVMVYILTLNIIIIGKIFSLLVLLGQIDWFVMNVLKSFLRGDNYSKS